VVQPDEDEAGAGAGARWSANGVVGAARPRGSALGRGASPSGSAPVGAAFGSENPRAQSTTLLASMRPQMSSALGWAARASTGLDQAEAAGAAAAGSLQTDASGCGWLASPTGAQLADSGFAAGAGSADGPQSAAAGWTGAGPGAAPQPDEGSDEGADPQPGAAAGWAIGLGEAPHPGDAS